MEITVLSVVDQETGRSVVTRPVESRSSALKATLSCPTTRLAVSGTTVTVATGSGEPTTWIVSEPLSPPLVAVIVAYPGWRPVTVAVSLTPTTCAIELSLLVHVTDGFGIGLPFASPTAAYSVMVPPMPTDDGPETRTYGPVGWGSTTDSGVVAPAVTCTLCVITACRDGYSGSMRTVYEPAPKKAT